MESVATVDIDCPIDEVFRLTTEHVAQWSIIVVEDALIEEKPEGVGTTFRTITEEQGKRMEFDGVVTKYDAPRLQAIHMTGEFFDIDTEFRFEAISSGTRVTQSAEVTGKGIFRVYMMLLGWMMRRAHCKSSEDELGSLKKYCESQVESVAG